MTGPKLGSLLAGRVVKDDPAFDIVVTMVTADSREVKEGALFVAVAGEEVDGHNFIPAALAAGAVAVVVAEGRDDFACPVPVIAVENCREALGQIAADFYGNPAAKMTMVAITGTNGKTTCSYLLEEMIRAAGGNPGVIGTINYRYNGKELAASHTTPDPLVLQRLLAEMVGAGVTHVVMEVSSHSLSQDRVAGITFAVALFTNLSRDHLDYHGDMTAYYRAKERLFSHYLQGQAVVVDDGSSWSRRLIGFLAQGEDKRATLICGGEGADISGQINNMNLAGMDLDLELLAKPVSLHSPLVGEFNLYNILAVLGVGYALGLTISVMIEVLGLAKGAPGRLERILGTGDGSAPAVFVDYAHTPDALENILRTMGHLCQGRLILLFGCGGDRDRGKRQIMGQIAATFADYVVLTSDNPRGEDPEKILGEIGAGVKQKGGVEYSCIPSRQEAIAHAIGGAGDNDVVLIVGKGHEEYQLIKKDRVRFDDRQVAQEQLRGWG